MTQLASRKRLLKEVNPLTKQLKEFDVMLIELWAAEKLEEVCIRLLNHELKVDQ